MSYSEVAQQTIEQLISNVRMTGDLSEALGEAVKSLAQGLRADSGLIWQIVGDKLTVTHEHSTNASRVIGTSFDSEISTHMILEFLTRFIDSAERGSIAFDASNCSDSWKPLCSLSKSFNSNLIAQVRADYFFGFLSLHSDEHRTWAEEEIAAVAQVADLMSILLKDARILEVCAMDGARLDALAKIQSVFLEKDGSAIEIILKALAITADFMGFSRSRLYLGRSDDLYYRGSVQLSGTGPLYSSGDLSQELSAVPPPLVQVFKSGEAVLLAPNGADSKTFEQFGDHLALIMPLVDYEGKPLGVFALWERTSDLALPPQTRESALWIAGQISKCISFAKLLSNADDLLDV